MKAAASRNGLRAPQVIYTRVYNAVQLLTWPFNPPTAAAKPLDTCRPCSALVLLVFSHVIVNLLTLYAYYLSEWKLRRLFLRSRPGLPAQQVARVCDTRLARLLIDAEYGVAESLLAHAAVVVHLAWLSWAASHVLVLHVFPWVVPGRVMVRLCPDAPGPCSACPW